MRQSVGVGGWLASAWQGRRYQAEKTISKAIVICMTGRVCVLTGSAHKRRVPSP